jgi:hypothetical protein
MDKIIVSFRGNLRLTADYQPKLATNNMKLGQFV